MWSHRLWTQSVPISFLPAYFPPVTVALFEDCRHHSVMSEYIHSLLQAEPDLTLGLRMLPLPTLIELSVVEVNKDIGHSLRVPWTSRCRKPGAQSQGLKLVDSLGLLFCQSDIYPNKGRIQDRSSWHPGLRTVAFSRAVYPAGIWFLENVRPFTFSWNKLHLNSFIEKARYILLESPFVTFIVLSSLRNFVYPSFSSSSYSSPSPSPSSSSSSFLLPSLQPPAPESPPPPSRPTMVPRTQWFWCCFGEGQS